MKTPALILALTMIGLSVSSQTLIQPYQIRVATNDFLVMATPGTNLQATLAWMSSNWHSKQGYGTTNQINAFTNQLNALSNSVMESLSNQNASVSGLVASVYVLTNGFLARNASAQVLAGASIQQFTCTDVMKNVPDGAWDGSKYVVPSAGVYRYGFRADYSNPNVTSSDDRIIVKLYLGESEYATIHRHGLYHSGTETVIGGEFVMTNAASDLVSIRATRDGTVAMTNAIGGLTVWGFQERIR